jgi:hypothetical protein
LNVEIFVGRKKVLPCQFYQFYLLTLLPPVVPTEFLDAFLRKFQVYQVVKSTLGNFYVCSCHEGSKKSPCKHAAVIMAKKNIVKFPKNMDEVKDDTPLQGLRKKRRPKMSEAGRPHKDEKQKRF